MAHLGRGLSLKGGEVGEDGELNMLCTRTRDFLGGPLSEIGGQLV